MKTKFNDYFFLSEDLEISPFLSESPMRIDALHHLPFDILSQNIKITKDLIDKTIIEPITNFENHIIYQSSDGNKVKYYLITKDKKYPVTDGYVQGQIINNEFHEYFIWQTSLIHGLMRKFYLDYLIPNHHTIISDDSHTALGERFWIVLTNEALNKGYKILAKNHLTNQELIINNYNIVKSFFGDDRYIDWHIIIKDI